ncbi:MAG TPA: ATP-binding protein [Burkholderiaceae bacterium]
MEKFALDTEVAQLEADLQCRRGGSRLDVLVPLAWHLRERDTRRALELATEAQTLLSEAGVAEHERQRMAARMCLISGEAKWLFSELLEAHKLARQALQVFEALGDFAGCSDVHWLLASISSDDHTIADTDGELEQCAADADRAGDRLRGDVARAFIAVRSSHRDPHHAKELWGKTLPVDTSVVHPALATWVERVWASFAMQVGDFGHAVTCSMQAHESALASGQLRRAVHSAVNASDCFNYLNDYDSAFEWAQRGLNLARTTSWPVSTGACLTQMGETLRKLGQFDAGRDLLHEALQALRPCMASRSYANALNYLGCLENDSRQHQVALVHFQQLMHISDELRQTEFQITSRTGQALALSQMGREEEARGLAKTALKLARDKRDPLEEIYALKVTAELHKHSASAARAGSAVVASNHPAAETPLYFLSQAIEVAGSMEGFLIDSSLYDLVAEEYAKAGDYEKAYAETLKASAARAKAYRQETANRAIAMQIQHRTERAREEAQHFKSLAEVEARRAEMLHQNSQTLERLSAIGREITAHIDAAAVFQALDRHVHAMLDAHVLNIWLVEGNKVKMRFGVEEGTPLQQVEVTLDSEISNAARCVRELREIYVHSTVGQLGPSHVSGTRPMLSCLFAPLAVGDTVFGVLSIQSPRENAYGERELQIFRTLLAYGSVALANAANARKLADVNIELERQRMATLLVHAGKMMAVGKLASSVVHEMSHPVGSISMLTDAIQTLREKNRDAEALDVTLRIGREVNRLRGLILRLRKFARSDPADVAAIGLHAVMDDARQLYLHQLDMENVQYLEEIEPVSVLVDSERLSLAVANIVLNACDAMTARSNKLVRMKTRVDGECVRLSIRDNGPGLAPEVLERIMEPFFTTKPDGLGLGLSISAESLASMNGAIEVCNHLDGGAEFTLVIPLAPATMQLESV